MHITLPYYFCLNVEGLKIKAVAINTYDQLGDKIELYYSVRIHIFHYSVKHNHPWGWMFMNNYEKSIQRT